MASRVTVEHYSAYVLLLLFQRLVGNLLNSGNSSPMPGGGTRPDGLVGMVQGFATCSQTKGLWLSLHASPGILEWKACLLFWSEWSQLSKYSPSGNMPGSGYRQARGILIASFFSPFVSV